MALHELRYGSERHHQELEVLCASALERGDLDAAYRFSDRRCRIKPLPEAHCYVLRAEALHRMGEHAAAIADLETALAITPDDLAANRRLLSWGDRQQRATAARALIAHERDPDRLRTAIAVLRENGRQGFAQLELCGDRIEGWAAWRGKDPARVSIAAVDNCRELRLEADPQHALRDSALRATSFSLPRLPTTHAQTISVTCDGAVVASLRIASPDRPVGVTPAVMPTVRANAPATVIVPVYGDFQATNACLRSLRRALKGSNVRTIIVDDAGPDPDIRDLLDRLPKQKNLTLLRNASNVGFAAAVNRALRETPAGDVVLLNADTVVPAGFIDRLAAAARSAPDVGTVTPLSNNGEFTSFPLPNQPNPAGGLAHTLALDRVAREVNTDAVDLPNGIGFCLYITRACLDAVGPLSESYQRGYFEDVDFCLRARQRGFRNVCATSVYVEHAGSRSFGKQKRSLVVRNLDVIGDRFPAYRAECAAFVLADPLKAARHAIELRMIASRPRGPLLVSMSGVVADVAHERARFLLAGGEEAVLLLTVRLTPAGAVASLRDAADGVPQSLDFDLRGSDALTALLDCLRQASLERIEFLDLGRLPSKVLDGLLALGIPHDIFVAHGDLELSPASMKNVIADAGTVFVPDPHPRAIAAALGLSRSVSACELYKSKRGRRAAKPKHRTAVRLGLLPVRGDAREQQLMRELVVTLNMTCPELAIVVVGAPFDDGGLARAGNVFVTGEVAADELESTVRRCRLDRLLLCLARPLFGHPLVAAAMTAPVPVARLDWSSGKGLWRTGDLRIDADLSPAEIAGRMRPWLQAPRSK